MAAYEQRDKKRDRERRARQRRLAKLEQMRFARHTLQNAVLAVRTLEESSWERFLNPDAMRVRHFLLASKQATNLRHEQAMLRRLLQQYELAAGAVSHILNEQPSDDWEEHVDRSHKLTQKHYIPRTLPECQIEMDASLQAIHAYEWEAGFDPTETQIFGWKEQRRLDHARHLLQFQFAKSFRGYSIIDSVNTLWDAYTDSKTFRQVILGHRLLGTTEILQQLGPNAVVVRMMERFPGIVGDIHIVYLVFRVKTERGYTQCVRSLHCPELVEALGEPQHVWPSNFFWMQWEELKDEANGYELKIGGSFHAHNSTYLDRWMSEVFGCVVRAEHLATKRPLVARGT